MYKATIFYNHQAWQNEELEIFDVRYDAQIIPAGSVVSGLLFVNDQNTTQVVWCPPSFVNKGQEDCWNRVLEEAENQINPKRHTQ